MTFQQEYHRTVNRSLSASVAVFAVVAFLTFAAPSGHAQANNGNSGGAHSGGASFGSTSQAHSFVPPTGGVRPPTGPVAPPTGPNVFPHAGNPQHPHHHTNGNGNVAAPYLYGVAVPYAVPYADDNSGDADTQDDANYQGGPTVFDRRGSGANSYIPPEQDAAAAPDSQAPDVADPDQPQSPQDPTTLVFKDGHQIEVTNYAIVGQTLYDLTPGHRRKIALAELDLPATQMQNDSNGITFQVPASAQAN
jgi:hypothetical protein